MSKQKTQYDADVLQTYAEQLYEEAKRIVQISIVKYVAGGCALTLLVGFGLAVTQPRLQLNGGGSVFALTVVMLMAGMVGYEKGKRLAWEKKFEAQQLLLHMQIEKNTRTSFVMAGEDRADPRLSPPAREKLPGMSAV